MKAMISLAIVNTALSVSLVILYGFPGAVLATTIALGSAHLINLILFHRYLRLPLLSFLARAWCWPAIGCALAGLVTVFLHRVAGVDWNQMSRGEAIAWLAGKGIMFLLVYAWVILRSPYLDGTDWRLIHTWLPWLHLPWSINIRGNRARAPEGPISPLAKTSTTTLGGRDGSL
jgi:hypothetical protein